MFADAKRSQLVWFAAIRASHANLIDETAWEGDEKRLRIEINSGTRSGRLFAFFATQFLLQFFLGLPIALTLLGLILDLHQEVICAVTESREREHNEQFFHDDSFVGGNYALPARDAILFSAANVALPRASARPILAPLVECL
jgi:hypothetical protein